MIQAAIAEGKFIGLLIPAEDLTGHIEIDGTAAEWEAAMNGVASEHLKVCTFSAPIGPGASFTVAFDPQAAKAGSGQ
jgi:hypothetical protein